MRYGLRKQLSKKTLLKKKDRGKIPRPSYREETPKVWALATQPPRMKLDHRFVRCKKKCCSAAQLVTRVSENFVCPVLRPAKKLMKDQQRDDGTVAKHQCKLQW